MHDKLVARLRFQIAAVLILKHALLWLAVWAFVWGTVVVVCRVTGMLDGDALWLGLIGVPLCLVGAAVFAMRILPGRDQIRAVVDRSCRCGGLLMAAAETPLGSWQIPSPQSRLEVQWRGGRAWLAFLAGGAYLLIALLFPQTLVSLAAEAPLDITKEAHQLAAQLDILKHEAVFEPQQAERYKEQLKQIQEQAKGASPVKTLEALDHLRELAKKAAQQAAESAIAKTEKLSQPEGLADALRKNDGALAPKVEKEALATLAELLQKAAAETDLLDKHLDPELLKHLQAAKINPELLKKLAEALKGGRRDLSKMLDKLHAARLIDAEMLKKLEDAGKCDVAAALKELGGKMNVGDIVAQCLG